MSPGSAWPHWSVLRPPRSMRRSPPGPAADVGTSTASDTGTGHRVITADSAASRPRSVSTAGWMPRARFRKLCQCRLGLLVSFIHQLTGPFGLGIEPLPRPPQVHGQRHQSLLGSVVQVPLDPMPLSLRTTDRAGPADLQFVDAPGQVRLPARTEQPPHHLPLDSRQCHRRLGSHHQQDHGADEDGRQWLPSPSGHGQLRSLRSGQAGGLRRRAEPPAPGPRPRAPGRPGPAPPESEARVTDS